MATKEVKGDKEGFKIRHTETAEERVDNAVKVIYAKLRQMTAMKDRIDALAAKNVDTGTVKRVLDRIYNPEKYPEESAARTQAQHRREEVIRQFEEGETAQTFTKDNAWKLFNAATFGVYNPVRTNKKTDRAEIAYSASLGTLGGKIANWFQIVEEEANRLAA